MPGVTGFSAVFDTVGHEVLLQKLHITYGVNGVAHDWFRSYLTGHHQYVRVRASQSSTVLVRYGVPQGSVLGPILFLLYTADTAALVGSHGLYMSTSMPTTLKYMDLVHRCQLINYSQAYRPALTMLLAGWRQIGSS